MESRNSPRNSPRGSLADESYDTNFRKAQPQVPTGNRYHSPSPAKELPPYEAPPVYENIQEINFPESRENKAGPQVPSNYYNPATVDGGDYVVMTGKQLQKGGAQARSRGQSYDGSIRSSQSMDQSLRWF